jgi:thiamine-phosphate pyrophosphorylase
VKTAARHPSDTDRETERTEYPRLEIDSRLYLITDRALFPEKESLYAALEKALRGGCRAVQLREKDLSIRELLAMAYDLRTVTQRHRARLFVNDRVDVAMAVGADGVHLGRTGIPPSAAKKASQGALVVGASTHSLKEALDAEKDGADFITFGPVYQTPSKLRYGEPVGRAALHDAVSAVSIPVFAIGGITPERTAEVTANGAHGVALISAILSSSHVQETTEQFTRCLS